MVIMTVIQASFRGAAERATGRSPDGGHDVDSDELSRCRRASDRLEA